MLKNSRTLSKDDREMMLNIDAIYDEWRNTAVKEGHQAGIVAMLIAKFGAIDTELERIIPALLDMAPVERARSIMTLSRKALLDLMQNKR